MSTLDTSIPCSRTVRSNTRKRPPALGHFISIIRHLAIVGSALIGSAYASQLQVTWTDNSSDETGFKIERSINGATFTQIATVSANVTSYVDTNLLDASYSYRIRAYSDSSDSDYTDPTAAYVINSNVAPSISSQPASQTVLAGSNVAFTVAASGSPTPTFQWSKNGSAISGATSGALALTSVTAADAGNYTVTVNNIVGSVQSSAAVLVVNPVILNSAPAFVLQPVTQTAAPSANVTFSVSVSGSPTPTLQWQKDGAAISGANSSTLILSGVTTASGGSYRVVASNSVGTATSTAASLTVSVSNSAPIFTLQPSNQTAAVGTSLTLSTSVSGNPTPSLQWQKDGVNISGANNVTLALTNITSAMAGSYRVIASNSVGSATSSAALLTVSSSSSAPVFVVQPTNQTAVAGSNVTLSTSVNGNPTPSLQWQKDGVTIVGATNATLSLTNVTSATAGAYRVVASNSAGSATSSSASLTVTALITTAAPVFVSQPNSQTVSTGSKVTLIATATGTPMPAYQWKKNGVAIVGANTSTYMLTADATTTGSYTVTATNSMGSAESATAQVATASAQTVTTSRLVNASIRANAGQGSDTLIVGFVTNGAQKSVLLRGIGPGLAAYTNATTFADPLLTLYSGKSALMANDNWSDLPALQNVFAQVGAFALNSPSKDAALMANLAPNAYTAQITGNGSGMALVELYDTDADSTAGRIVNIAARAGVSGSDNVVIVGFVVQGSSPKQVLIRGIGPSLAPLGVVGALSATHLQLFQGSALLQDNSNWGGSQTLVSAFAQVGAFPLSDSNSKDTALLATLNPGTYTVILSGSNSTSGVALIELYEMP